MPDLDAAIRGKLKRREHVFPGMGAERRQLIADWCETVEGAVLAVLELHKPKADGECAHCVDEGSISSWGELVWYHENAPCPTVRLIAEKLGIETADE